MNKSDFQSIIKKYYLDGKCPAVKWNVESNNLSVNFTTIDVSTLGSISANVEIADGTFGIYNTDKLLSILSALGNEVKVDFNYEKNKAVGLKITDEVMDVNFMLAAESVIPESKQLKSVPDWDFEIPLTKEFIDRFIKAKKAISDAKIFAIITNDSDVDVIINHDKNNTDRIKFTAPAKITSQADFIGFGIDTVSTILSANSSDFRTATMKVSSKGLAQFHFIGEDYEVTYYVKSVELN